MEGMKLDQLIQMDALSPVMDLLLEGNFRLDVDGKIRPIFPARFELDGPWLNQKVCSERNCVLWHTIYFQRYRLISRNCYNCWKVTVRPQTITDLFKIYQLQMKYVRDKEDALPCKCGTERRDQGLYKGIYLAFWYNPLGCSLAEAKENHKEIAALVRRELPINTEVILKRGCTEFEDANGPSDRWIYIERNHDLEDILDDLWDVPKFTDIDPNVLRTLQFRKWISWGIRHRDPEAKKYVGDIRIFGVHPTTVYHDKEVRVMSLPQTSKQREEAKADADNGLSAQREESVIQRLSDD